MQDKKYFYSSKIDSFVNLRWWKWA